MTSLPRAIRVDLLLEQHNLPQPFVDERALARGRLRRRCRECNRWIEEDVVDGEQVTNHYAAHYVREHERAKYLTGKL